jgi:hypothetical protein
MTRHRRITGFVAIVLIAAAATVSTTRSHLRSTDGMVASTIATLNFDDRWSAISAAPSIETAERTRN